MFRKLRNHFILINLLTTSLILIAAFSCVYLVAENSNRSRRPIPTEINFFLEEGQNQPEQTQDSIQITPDQNKYFKQIMEERIEADRKASLDSLLVTLVVIGIAVEIIVAIFSYLFAEQAIKPVKEAYEAQKIFIANASHEIKTPVAAIKANLEAADLSEENHWIKNIELEADKIETLNLALLRLAKTDVVKETITLEDIDIKRTLNGIMNSFASRIEQKDITLETTYDLKKNQLVKLNRSDFREIVEILLDNAIKYCEKSVIISASPKSFKITNDGTVIPKDKISHVFDRFYQVDKSASGSGLGLAIAKSLSDRNNWNLEVQSSNGKTEFELKF